MLVGDVRIETQARVLAVARVHVAGGIAALCGAEELPVRRRCGAVAPGGCNREPAVRVDDSGECCGVGFRTRIGVCGPDQLVAADTLAGSGHAAKTEIGRVGQHCGEKCTVIVAMLARAQVGEDRREAGRSVHIVQPFGDAYGWQQCVDPIGEAAGIGRCGRLYRRDV